MPNTILVGVDGSPSSLMAVDWAVREATLRGGVVRLLFGRQLPAVVESYSRDQERADLYQRMLREAENRAREQDGSVPVSSEMVFESPAHMLTEPRPGVGRIVVGVRGRGGFPELTIGSVAYQVAAHANVPVTVVGTEPQSEGGEIVVGVDGSRRGDAALAEAFEAAALYNADVRAVHAERLPTDPMVGDLPTYPPSRGPLYTERENMVLGALASWKEKYPQVQVTSEVEWDDAVHALSEASRGARLLVVGARGRRGFAFLALGSVSHGVLHHACCPVTVVHGGDSPSRRAE